MRSGSDQLLSAEQKTKQQNKKTFPRYPQKVDRKLGAQDVLRRPQVAEWGRRRDRWRHERRHGHLQFQALERGHRHLQFQEEGQAGGGGLLHWDEVL